MLLCLTLMIKVKEFNGDYSKCVKTKDVDKSMRKPIQTHQTISLRKKKTTLHIYYYPVLILWIFSTFITRAQREGNSTYPIEKDEGDALFKV